MILSIVIPMYNVEKFLEKCIVSCENQDLSKKDYEIVAVNDGSPDNSLQIAEKLATQYPNIKVVTRTNGGLSAARNTGLDNACGEYIFFVDSDDWIAENCLGKIANVLRKQTPDVLCICAANVFEEQIQRRMDYANLDFTNGPDSMMNTNSSCAPFQIVRKAHLNKYNIRFYEGIYHEDVEYTPRMRYFAKKVCYINDIVYYVYQNPNSITRTVNVKKIYDVITVVAPRIYEFTKMYVDCKYKQKYYGIIASAINTVLTNNYPLSREDSQKINNILFENRYLYEAFCMSSIFKYKLEGCLFKLFPVQPIRVFNLMKFRF